MCLEAIELGYLGIKQPQPPNLEIMLVARFAGRNPGAALIGFDAAREYHEEMRCELTGRTRTGSVEKAPAP